MRLFAASRYLDGKGMEALLARAVLRGQTRGYRHHPQLDGFREHVARLGASNAYLVVVHAVPLTRGYRFVRRRLGSLRGEVTPLPLRVGRFDRGCGICWPSAHCATRNGTRACADLPVPAVIRCFLSR